jgi:hypothetical protein
MKFFSVVMLMMVLAGAALGEDRPPANRELLEAKRRVAPVRGRRLAPMRAVRDREADETAPKKEHRDRGDRGRSDGGLLGGLDVLDD